MDNSMEASQKTKHRVTIWSRSPTLGDIPRQSCNSKRCTYRCVQVKNNTVRSSQGMETPDMSVKRGGRKKRWRVYVTEHHAAMRKSELMPCAATRTDPEVSTLADKSEGERQTPSDITDIRNLNMTQKNLSMRQQQTYRHREQTCGCQGERGCESLALADENYHF